MKVTFDIECSPEEARKFLGLPDVVPMQEALMKELQDKMAENFQTMDTEALAKTWFPLMMQGWTDMQKSFWGQFQGSTPNPFAGPFAPGFDSEDSEKKKDT